MSLYLSAPAPESCVGQPRRHVTVLRCTALFRRTTSRAALLSTAARRLLPSVRVACVLSYIVRFMANNIRCEMTPRGPRKAAGSARSWWRLQQYRELGSQCVSEKTDWTHANRSGKLAVTTHPRTLPELPGYAGPSHPSPSRQITVLSRSRPVIVLSHPNVRVRTTPSSTGPGRIVTRAVTRAVIRSASWDSGTSE